MKRLAFTDIHFGKSMSREHNQMCVEFIEWAIGTARDHSVGEIVFGGDWHDHRNKIDVETLNYSVMGLELLDACGIPVTVIIGNHDMPYRNSRDNHSLPWAAKYTNITVVTQPVLMGTAAYVPYLVETDDPKKVAEMCSSAQTVFGHFEFGGFEMNGAYVMPDKEGHLGGEHFDGPSHIYSGHFHKRQMKRNSKGAEIHYIGNCFPHDFGDAGDVDRGAAIMEDGKGPTYFTWPDQPTYHRVKMEDLADVMPTLGKRAVVRCVPMDGMTKDERLGFVEEISKSFEAKFTLEPARAKEPQSGAKWEEGATIDGLVTSWISEPGNVTSGLDPDVLITIYREAKST